MRLPATPGWVSLLVVVGVPRHSWLRAPGAVPCHSWLGSAGGGGAWLLASLLWSWLRFPATPGWGPPAVAVAVSVGLGGGFLVVCVFMARCVRAWCLCWCVCRVFVVVAWVWVCLPCVLVCVCVWVSGWGRLGFAAGVGVRVVGVCRGWSLANPWRRFLSAISRHSWLGSAVGGGGRSSPLLAEGPLVRFPATPGWGPLAVLVCGRLPLLAAGPSRGSPPLLVGGPLVAVVGGPLPLLAEGLGGGSPPLLAGVRRPRRWVFPRVGVFCVVCACGVACARGVWAGLCGVCLWCLCWWWCGCGRAFRACVCVCVCVWRAVWCGVVCWWGCGCCVLWLVPRHSWQRFLCATPRHSWLGFAAGGGGCSSPLLAEGPGCGSPPLLAGVRRRWWCAAPRHSWLGPASCAGVFRWWGCSLLCVFVVCVAARGGGAVLCVVCLWCPRCWWFGVVVRWVCLPRALVCVVACVWCAGGVWFVVPALCG